MDKRTFLKWSAGTIGLGAFVAFGGLQLMNYLENNDDGNVNKENNNKIKPFKIQIHPSILEDLHLRLKMTRFPDEIKDSAWNYGTNLNYMKNVTEYWKNSYDWRAQENMLNSFEQYTSEINGLKIHFMYRRGKGKKPFPLLIIHGWPSSFVEMVKIVPLLTDPVNDGSADSDSFDVIVPSLPGIGFSETSHEPGFGVEQIAEILFKLMTETLGYKKFGVHGADWGSRLSSVIGFKYPEDVLGIHITSVTTVTPSQPYKNMLPLSKAETQMLETLTKWYVAEGGYVHIQNTKPQSLAYGLNDSPVGLAAWIIEKDRDWSDCDGNVENVFTKDELLTNIMIYWCNDSINPSMRLYYEYSHKPWILAEGQKIKPPCAVVALPKDIIVPLREWGERFYNIQRWTEFPKGGHFPSMEVPKLLAADLRAFFRTLRDL